MQHETRINIILSTKSKPKAKQNNNIQEIMRKRDRVQT